LERPIKLSTAQQELLRRAVDRYAPELRVLLADVPALPLCDRNRLRSALGSLLTAVGFDAHWNVTPLGAEIEDLIDVLGPK
jgi:hypothetical protein